jgi:GntR family transcriptional regulator, transcriptional repressor for pyruvate dehydrogenase complex
MSRADAGPRAGERPAAVLHVDRVRKAYEQVADQLRELIRDGELAQGERLPNETVLAAEFGVSRATVREALRLLAAQNLIRTAKGAGGGSYVMLPSVDHISDFLQASIKLLTEAQDVTLEELLEARALLEVPAARLAAARHRDEDVERLRAAIPPDGSRLATQEQFVHNKEFHTVVIESSGNTLLAIAAQPIFTVLQTHLARSVLGRRFHGAVADQHRAITAAIAAGDARAAEQEMHAHLEFLRPFYEKAWRRALRARERT